MSVTKISTNEVEQHPANYYGAFVDADFSPLKRFHWIWVSNAPPTLFYLINDDFELFFKTLSTLW